MHTYTQTHQHRLSVCGGAVKLSEICKRTAVSGCINYKKIIYHSVCAQGKSVRVCVFIRESAHMSTELPNVSVYASAQALVCVCV